MEKATESLYISPSVFISYFDLVTYYSAGHVLIFTCYICRNNHFINQTKYFVVLLQVQYYDPQILFTLSLHDMK